MSFSLHLLATFLFAAFFTALWLRLALNRRWLVSPNARSSHAVPVPSGGGIGFVISFLIYIVWSRDTLPVNGHMALMLAGASMLALIGLVDDFSNLGIRLRLGLQVIVIAVLWPYLQDMPPFILGGMTIDGLALVALLSAGLLWHINLYNFMDGIDALAAMQGLFLCIAFPLLAGERAPAVFMMLALGVAVCGFLIFNLPTARLFMGDAGSYFLGYMLPVLAFGLIKQGYVSIWSVLILGGTFIVDSTTTLLGRFSQGAVWYHGHRTHAYQLLAIRWKSHGYVVVAYAAINVCWLLPLAWLAVDKPALGPLLTLVAWSPLVLLVLVVRSSLATATS